MNGATLADEDVGADTNRPRAINDRPYKLQQKNFGTATLSLQSMILLPRSTRSYLYSTEHSNYATVISVLRSIIANAAVILILPRLFGAASVWLTFAVYEAIVLVVIVVIVKHSERNGIIFK